jgi:predicted dehydrogenase
LAEQSGAPLALASHLDLPGEVDLAIVAVPNAMHEPVSVDLLTAGVHVLVEKPMARTVAECDRMIAAARSTGALLAVGHDFRHFPIARFARDLLIRTHGNGITRWWAKSAVPLLILGGKPKQAVL